MTACQLTSNPWRSSPDAGATVSPVGAGGASDGSVMVSVAEAGAFRDTTVPPQVTRETEKATVSPSSSTVSARAATVTAARAVRCGSSARTVRSCQPAGPVSV